MRGRGGIWSAGLLLAQGMAALALPAAGQDLVVRGGELRPVSGPPVADGVVVVRDGRIVAVGSAAEVEVPPGLPVLDATGMIVTPGFLDARTSLALGRGAGMDRDRLLRPDVRMADHLGALEVPGVFGMEARDAGVHPWVMDGVTAAYVAPAPANLVGGFGAVVKLAGERLGDVVDPAAALHVSIGEAPLRFFDAPTTRQGLVAVLRQWLVDLESAAGTGAPVRLRGAADDADALSGFEHPLTPDLRRVLAGEIPVRFHAHAPEDVLTALRVAREAGLRSIVEGAAGAHVVAADLAAAGVPVVLGPSMFGAGGGGAPEMSAHTAEGAARLHRAGVPLALSTDASGGRSVTMEAVIARGHGLGASAALRALTLDAARILGVDGRLGSLEPGKDADLVLWRGDPVGTWGEATVVIVDGRTVFRRGGEDR